MKGYKSINRCLRLFFNDNNNNNVRKKRGEEERKKGEKEKSILRLQFLGNKCKMNAPAA